MNRRLGDIECISNKLVCGIASYQGTASAVPTSRFLMVLPRGLQSARLRQLTTDNCLRLYRRKLLGIRFLNCLDARAEFKPVPRSDLQ